VKYYNLKRLHTIEQSKTRRLYRRFSKADDEMIMNYIEKHGEHDYVFLELASELNLRYVQQVKTRFSRLTSGISLAREKTRNKRKNDVTTDAPKNPGEPRKIWTIEEDKQLLDIVFKNVPKMESEEYETLCSLDSFKFTSLTDELPRKPETPRQRWKRRLLPIVKSYVLKIPEFPEKYFHLKEEIIQYIIENEIECKDDIDAIKIEKEMFPGQTVGSIKQFINSLENDKLDKHEPLYEVCKRRDLFYLINDHFQNSYHSIEQLQEIAKHYDMITKK